MTIVALAALCALGWLWIWWRGTVCGDFRAIHNSYWHLFNCEACGMTTHKPEPHVTDLKRHRFCDTCILGRVA